MLEMMKEARYEMGVEGALPLASKASRLGRKANRDALLAFEFRL